VRAAVLVLAFAAIAAGCGSAEEVSLEKAADTTAADTARFEMRYEIAGIPVKKTFTMTASGRFDFPKERAVMSVNGDFATLAGFAEDVAFKEFRLLGNAGYAQWTIKGKDYWVKEAVDDQSGDPAQLLLPAPGTPTKPTDVLARVVHASAENAEVAKEEVRGTETTHFRARVDLKKLVEQLPPAERPHDATVRSGPQVVPVDIWIDGDNRLRRITMEQKEEDSTMSTRFDLFDYGVDVEVEQPPAENVISQEEFDKLTADSKGTYSLVPGEGEGELVTPKEPGQPGNKESE